MNVRDIINRYEIFCPKDLSLEGDIAGLQIGHYDKPVKKVMITLDVKETTVAEAITKGVDLIITKHAPIFKPLKDLVGSAQSNFLLDLVKHDIAVYVSHTNIDVLQGGLNDWFCEMLDITDTTVLKATTAGQGIGRVGQIQKQTLEEFALQIKKTFSLDSIRLIRYGKDNPEISRVAICGGSAEQFYQEALQAKADVYITGDIYYHKAQEMLTEGLYAIDPGHHIEAIFIDRVAELVDQWRIENDWAIEVLVSQTSTNPFNHL